MFKGRSHLERIRKIADYQFGKGVGEVLFPDNVEISFSKRTGRIRYIYLDGKLLATLNPITGLFALTIEGARRVLMKARRLWVKISDDSAPFVEGGGDVFAKYVIESDENIHPGDEVIVIDQEGNVIAVGRAVLSGAEMKAFRRGIAVKVRRGRRED